MMADLTPSQPEAVQAPQARSAGTGAGDREAAIHDAFLLGWLLMELRSRVRVAYAQCEAPNPPKGFGLELASQWRALFSRIADLHHTKFADGSTAETLYEPPTLDYLHPKDAPDYADIGIRCEVANGAPFLHQFGLYGETRRALNAISLLYVDADDSLMPDQIAESHRRLIDAALGVTLQPPSPTLPETGSPSGTPSPQRDRMLQAKEALTRQTVKFLDAWDGYLRENLYVGGVFPNDDLELIAYEAGHSMSALSWGISVDTVSLEDVDGQGQEASARCLYAWQTAFRDQDVIRLQHQITALSSALDDEFYQLHTEVRRPADGAAASAPNPDLPSECILAVKHSIDYWQRTIQWLADRQAKKPDGAAADGGSVQDQMSNWKDMRLALTEQASVWQALMIGQQTLRSFSLENITRQIMKDITDRIQGSLHRDFKKTLTQAEHAMKEVADEVKIVVRDGAEFAVSSLEELFQGSRSFLLPALGIIAVVSIALVAVAAAQKSTAQMSSFGGAAGIVTAVMGWFHLTNADKTKDARKSAIQTQSQTATSKLDAAPQTVQTAAGDPTSNVPEGGLLGRIEGAGGEAGTLVVSAFQKGYDQVRLELSSMGRSTAVAYPLVEFFVTTFTSATDEEEFLATIIWNTTDRNEEIQRIISAAFGPLAVFMTSPPSDGLSSKKKAAAGSA
jgi:hypothetical protein